MNKKLNLFRTIFQRSFSDNLKKRNSIGRLINLNIKDSKDFKDSKDINDTKDIKDKYIINGNTRKLQYEKNVKEFPIIAACTAESYDFSRLLPFLQKNFQLSPFICDEVLHVKMPTKSGEVFFFKNGSMVFWSTDAEADDERLLQELKENLLPTIKAFEISSFKEADFEELSYKVTPSNR